MELRGYYITHENDTEIARVFGFQDSTVRKICQIAPPKKTNKGRRGGSRTPATSKMELFMIIVNGWKPLTIITKSSILDVAGVLDLPLGGIGGLKGS